MDIQPRGLFLATALHHAVKLPAITLIKRGVVSNKGKVRAASMPLAANVTPHSGAGGTRQIWHGSATTISCATYARTTKNENM